MKLLRNYTTPLLIALTASSYPATPTAFAVMPDWWNPAAGNSGVIPEIDVELWADAAIAVTAATLLAAVQQPLTYGAQTVTVNSSTGVWSKTGHGLKLGDGPLFLSNTGGALPAGSLSTSGYYAIPVDANSFKLAASVQLALAGTFISVTDNGSGTTQIASSALTRRLHWTPTLLGKAADGAIALTATQMWKQRIAHSPRVVAYALTATLDTGAFSAQLVPIAEAGG